MNKPGGPCLWCGIMVPTATSYWAHQTLQHWLPVWQRQGLTVRAGSHIRIPNGRGKVRVTLHLAEAV